MKVNELDCSRCGGTKPVTEFYKRTKAKTGYSPWCKPCHADYDRERYHNLDKERKAANQKVIQDKNFNFVAEYLSKNPCILCGESALVVLDFDHRDETTKFMNVSDMLRGYSLEKIKKEIDKCDVLCANCHRKRTAIQFGWRKALLADAKNDERTESEGCRV